ncbi:MAG TPA: alpha/beta fold hydrolase [Allocoleopsis sp.]
MQVTQASSIAPVSGQYWQWRGQPIYYVRAGDRQSHRPPLLLIHGFGASTFHWRKNLAGLSQDFEVWAIDLLGFGRSAKPNWQYSGELWREQIHDFITEMIGQPTVLGGNSLGGYAALSVAAQYPEDAAGLVLFNSAGPFSDAQPAPKKDPIREVFGNFVQSLFQQPWASYLVFQYTRQRSVVRQTLQKVYLDQTAITDDLVDDILRAASDPGAVEVFASVFKTPQGEKVDVLLGRLQCPLLLLWGEHDPWMNARARSVKFRQHYPQLTEHFLNAGHCPHDEVPDQVNALLRDWVNAISA